MKNEEEKIEYNIFFHFLKSFILFFIFFSPRNKVFIVLLLITYLNFTTIGDKKVVPAIVG